MKVEKTFIKADVQKNFLIFARHLHLMFSPQIILIDKPVTEVISLADIPIQVLVVIRQKRIGMLH